MHNLKDKVSLKILNPKNFTSSYKEEVPINKNIRKSKTKAGSHHLKLTIIILKDNEIKKANINHIT